jgi:C4-type Zn-finger protein
VRANQAEGVSRERIFQDLEGLLRQIREEAEESSNGGVSEEQISDMARAVRAFSKVLEEHSDPIPERARGEYQRIREKLVRALRSDR